MKGQAEIVSLPKFLCERENENEYCMILITVLFHFDILKMSYSHFSVIVTRWYTVFTKSDTESWTCQLNSHERF